MASTVNRCDMRCTAFHEAGHAVACIVQDLAFQNVYIVPRTNEHDPYTLGPLGSVVRQVDKISLAKNFDEARKEIVVCFAGPISETLAYPSLTPHLDQNEPDSKDAISIAKFALVEFTVSQGAASFNSDRVKDKWPEISSLLTACQATAYQLVSTHKTRIDQLATLLLRQFDLSFEDVKRSLNL